MRPRSFARAPACSTGSTWRRRAAGSVIEDLGFVWFFVATSPIGPPVAALGFYVGRRRGAPAEAARTGGA
ncbi:hypothetical protein [Methylobacterium planeticum]|uniref:Uncharacterized protein n=1 Tax=Methylobacterium planeticum TaxID=2615211 RepID=A0A6N6MQ58_9HYPH|nr:hypothetical protein [Methylobacterium planeticum]KAB1072745.1 hypothetical protein F6X51_14130 [Methylobacterium planeticum]